MDATTLEAIEYDEVLRELSGFASTPIGREAAELTRPAADVQSVEKLFREYGEAAALHSERGGKLPLGAATDTRELLSRPYPEGSYLMPEDLLSIKGNLILAKDLKSLLSQSFRDKYPLLSEKLDALSEERELLREIERTVDDRGGILDGASSALFHIRGEIRSAKSRARGVLEGFLKDKKLKEALQEELITIREDRYVLVVVVGKHTEVRGIIHGRSGSGASYFIEPIELVEINNRLALLRKEEKAEEVEILKGLTVGVVSSRDALLGDLEVIGRLDLLQAKVLFSKELRCVVPGINKEGGVRFLKARHPLLVFKELRGGEKVTPVDILVEGPTRVVVISGANTGGKTVALKTIGLLILMASAGIPVPVEEGSTFQFFRSVFADIGDRQDLAASLSTFSAHVKRMNEILAASKEGSLVLIDEIGTGTDPSEGSAFAIAALETLAERGATSVVTTHLNLVKAHAHTVPGYRNVSVEFDEKTLKPLYNLVYGVPGASFGLTIARSLGIPGELVERAKTYLSEKEGAFIESIRLLEREREEVRKTGERLKEIEGKRLASLERLRDERRVLVERAKEKLAGVIARAEAGIRAKMDAIEERSRASARKAAIEVEDAGAKRMRAFSKTLKEEAAYTPSIGDRVTIVDSRTRGTVLRVDEDGRRAEVLVGSLKVWVDASKLARRGQSREPVKAAPAWLPEKTPSSINVIGMRAEEAVTLITKFLDDAHAGGLQRVEVVHGVGTGRLAKAVAGFLQESSLVKRFYFAEPSRGGGGVTVVELE